MTDSKTLSNAGKVISVISVSGEFIKDAVLEPWKVAKMNFARQKFDRLARILLTQIVPALGGYENELACDISRHVEQVRTHSENFCYRHRHLGQMHDAVDVGGSL